eukprot:g12419.t1
MRKRKKLKEEKTVRSKKVLALPPDFDEGVEDGEIDSVHPRRSSWKRPKLATAEEQGGEKNKLMLEPQQDEGPGRRVVLAGEESCASRVPEVDISASPARQGVDQVLEKERDESSDHASSMLPFSADADAAEAGGADEVHEDGEKMKPAADPSPTSAAGADPQRASRAPASEPLRSEPSDGERAPSMLPLPADADAAEAGGAHEDHEDGEKVHATSAVGPSATQAAADTRLTAQEVFPTHSEVEVPVPAPADQPAADSSLKRPKLPTAEEQGEEEDRLIVLEPEQDEGPGRLVLAGEESCALGVQVEKGAEFVEVEVAPETLANAKTETEVSATAQPDATARRSWGAEGGSAGQLEQEEECQEGEQKQIGPDRKAAKTQQKTSAIYRSGGKEHPDTSRKQKKHSNKNLEKRSKDSGGPPLENFRAGEAKQDADVKMAAAAAHPNRADCLPAEGSHEDSPLFTEFVFRDKQTPARSTVAEPGSMQSRSHRSPLEQTFEVNNQRTTKTIGRSNSQRQSKVVQGLCASTLGLNEDKQRNSLRKQQPRGMEWRWSRAVVQRNFKNL